MSGVRHCVHYRAESSLNASAVMHTRPMIERFEASTLGRVMLTALMAVFIAAILIWNLPASEPRNALTPVAARVLFPLGLEQDWATMFAPDPRNTSLGLYARVSYADGRELIWRPPARGHLLAPYRTYRWQKYDERVVTDAYQFLWEPTARWIAREAGPGVTRVVLVRTWQWAVTPGSGESRPDPQQYEFYSLDLS